MSAQTSKIAVDFYADDFVAEIPATLKVLEAVEKSGHDYRPDEKSKTGLEIARHIALEDAWLLQAALDGELGPVPDQSDACGLNSGEECAEHYRSTVPALVEKVRAMSGDDLSRDMDFFGLKQMPALGFVAMALHHSIHHRGQLAAYLRAMGGKVPGIYGPSADEGM